MIIRIIIALAIACFAFEAVAKARGFGGSFGGGMARVRPMPSIKPSTPKVTAPKPPTSGVPQVPLSPAFKSPKVDPPKFTPPPRPRYAEPPRPDPFPTPSYRYYRPAPVTNNYVSQDSGGGLMSNPWFWMWMTSRDNPQPQPVYVPQTAAPVATQSTTPPPIPYIGAQPPPQTQQIKDEEGLSAWAQFWSIVIIFALFSLAWVWITAGRY